MLSHMPFQQLAVHTNQNIGASGCVMVGKLD